MMERDASKSVRWKAIAPWAVVVLLVVVLPLATFGRSIFGWGSSRDNKAPEVPVVSGGTTYITREAFVMKPGDGAADADLHVGPSKTIISENEVIAPSPDGSKVWVVDHPTYVKHGARIRRFTVDGKLELSFVGQTANVLFTPGRKNDLWSIGSSGNGDQSLIHYSSKGKVLRAYPIPAGVRVRSISFDPDGEVWVQQEEWYLDPETNKGSYTSSMIPIVGADGEPVPDLTPEKTAEGSFLGPDDRLYTLESLEGTHAGPSDYLPFYVVARDQKGERISEYDVVNGGRPYAADLKGRVYSERAPESGGNVPGQSGLADPAFGWTVIAIYDTNGDVTYLPVTRDSSRKTWVPSAWPADDGSVFSSKWDDEGLHVLVSTPSGQKSPTTQQDAPKPQARVILSAASPRSGDPYSALDAEERDLWQMVYSGLVSHDASLNAVPNLAEAVPRPGAGVSGDGLTIEWKIRPGRVWHDGRPVTANDVVATWRYLCSVTTVMRDDPFPGSRYIKSVTADGNVVRVRLNKPFGPAPEAFFPFVLPAHVINGAIDKPNGGLYAHPVGCGPYKVTRWTSRGMVLEAASKDEGAPRIKTLEVDFETNDASAAFAGSTLPVYWSAVPDTDVKSLKAGADNRVSTYRSGRTFGLMPNLRDPLMKNDTLRMAWMKTYPSQVVRDLYRFDTTPTVTPFARVETPADTWARGSKGNAALVRVLRGMGYSTKSDPFWLSRDGADLRLRYSQAMRGEGNHETVSEVEDAWARQLASAKIILDFENGQQFFYATPSLEGFLSSGRHQMASLMMPSYIDAGWGSVFDPEETPSWSNQFGTAVSFTQDSELSRLHEEARASYDPAERQRLSTSIIDRARGLGIVYFDRPELRNSAARGIQGYAPAPYPAGEFYNVAEWTVR